MLTTLGDNKSLKEGEPSGKPGGGGWGFLGWIIPKKKNEVFLPDDKNPSVSDRVSQLAVGLAGKDGRSVGRCAGRIRSLGGTWEGRVSLETLLN